MNHKFLIHKQGDHVGVAIVDIDRGETVCGVFMDDDTMIEINACDAVPLGHKIAITDVAGEASVVEYGIPIGKATGGFGTGAHVHIHNLRSARW